MQALLSTPCKTKIKNQKIMVLIGESRNGLINARQSSYNAHINAINSRLKAMGLRTYTQEQIRQQVAQAERTDAAKGKVVIVPGLQYKALTTGSRLIPRGLVRALTKGFGNGRDRT